MEVFDNKDKTLNYSVWIVELGDNAFELVKTITDICGVSQMEAMKFVGDTDSGSLGGLVCSVAHFKEAEEIKEQLENAGATVELKCRRYKVVLEDVGDNEDDVIDSLVETLDLDEDEAKELITSVGDSLFGVTIKTTKKEAAAEKIKVAIEECGATVAVEEQFLELDEDGNPIQDELTDDDIAEELSDMIEEEVEKEVAEIMKGIYCVIDGKELGPLTETQFDNLVRFDIVDEDDKEYKSITETGVKAWVPETVDYVEPNVPDMSDFEL